MLVGIYVCNYLDVGTEEGNATDVVGVCMGVDYMGYWDGGKVADGVEELVADHWWAVHDEYSFGGDEEECWM
jgi:hypothetical protein